MKRLMEPRSTTPYSQARPLPDAKDKNGIVSELLERPEISHQFRSLLHDYGHAQADFPGDGLSQLICLCMRLGSTDLPRYILQHEHITELAIRPLSLVSPFDKSDWDLLHDALPDAFAVERLKLSELIVNDADTMQSMVRALLKMPSVRSLELTDVYCIDCPAGNNIWLDLDLFSATFTNRPNGYSVKDILELFLDISAPSEISIRMTCLPVRSELRGVALAIGNPPTGRLKTLRLSFGEETPECQLTDFARALTTLTLTPLQTFELELCSMPFHPVYSGFRPCSSFFFNELIEALVKHEAENISILGCRCESHSGVQLGRLISIPTLLHLELGTAGFFCSDLKLLCRTLGTNETKLRHLRGLKLRTADGYGRFADALRNNTTLEFLCLGKPDSDDLLSALVDAMQKNTALLEFDIAASAEPQQGVTAPPGKNMLAIQRRTHENRHNVLALAQGGMRMLLRADDTLGGRAGAIALDHIGRDAARVGLVNKEALKNTLDYRRAGAGSAD